MSDEYKLISEPMVLDPKDPRVPQRAYEWDELMARFGFQTQVTQATVVWNNRPKIRTVVEGIHWGRKKKAEVQLLDGYFNAGYWGSLLVTPLEIRDLIRGEKDEPVGALEVTVE